MKSVFTVLVTLLTLTTTAWAGGKTLTKPETYAMLHSLSNASVCFYYNLASIVPLPYSATLTRFDGDKVMYVLTVPKSDELVSIKVQLSADGKRVEYFKSDVYEIEQKNIGTIENPQWVNNPIRSEKDSMECIGNQNTPAGVKWPHQGL
ncbi:hypothetical protein [Bdellovibrio sp. HCB209]|uniref:hypothetical protein n=1 Tax=Bdellovibrio sp. HCB209 TaxID=3394354 RepID=UPI0039B3DC00